MTPRTAGAVAALLLAGSVLAGCTQTGTGTGTGTGSGGSAASGTAAPSASGSSNATAPPGPPLRINPFTGGKPSHNAVVAVKIDDTGNGRPQRGITQADIVYIEQVEGGLDRKSVV